MQTIYIDPPYNTGSDGFIYNDKFQHSSWLTMIENRLSLVRELMRDEGIIFTNIGDLNPQEGESFILQFLERSIFPKRFGNLIWKKRGGIGSFSEKNMTENHEYITVFGNKKSFIYHNILGESKRKQYNNQDERGLYRWMDLVGPSQQTKEKRPNLNYGILYDEVLDKIVGFEYVKNKEKEEYIFDKSNSGKIISIWLPGTATWLISKEVLEEYYKKGIIKVFKKSGRYSVKIKNYLFKEDGTIDGDILKSILTDNEVNVGMNIEATKEIISMFPNMREILDDLNPKPVSLVKLLIYTTTIEDNLVLDFFAGSGTTAHAVMKLNKEDGGKRKFILVEMGDYFNAVIIPRIKKVAYSFNWKDGKAQDADGIGGFFKYYELEQYEETLANTVYENHDMFIIGDKSPYEQYVFMKDEKMLRALEIDYENKKVNVDLSKLYQNIDIAETLSNLTGKWIKKITPLAPLQEGNYEVEFADGSIVNIKDLDYKLIKPLIWWE